MKSGAWVGISGMLGLGVGNQAAQRSKTTVLPVILLSRLLLAPCRSWPQVSGRWVSSPSFNDDIFPVSLKSRHNRLWSLKRSGQGDSRSHLCHPDKFHSIFRIRKLASPDPTRVRNMYSPPQFVHKQEDNFCPLEQSRNCSRSIVMRSGGNPAKVDKQSGVEGFGLTLYTLLIAWFLRTKETWPSGLRRRTANPLFGGSNPPVSSRY